MLKRNKPGKSKGLKISKPGRLLVFESTGFALYGTLATCGLRSTLTLSEPALSTAPNLAVAVGEVLAQLRQTAGKRLPKRAVLVTPSAAAQLLHLPVDPEKPRTPAQMSEMVRWELEEFLVNQNDLWSQGSLLQGRGYISAQQRKEAEGGDAAAPRPWSAGGSYHDMVPREQLDECLELLEQLTASDDDLVTGWSSQAVAEEEGPFTWLAAGIGGELRTRWVDAFRKQGLSLAWIYPQLGTALSHLAQEPGGWLLVEVRQEQFGLFQGRGTHLSSLALKPCRSGLADPVALAEAAHGGLLPDTAKIFLSAPADLAAPILDALGLRLGREVELLSCAGDPAWAVRPPEVLLSLAGAARHALGLCPPGALVRIQAQTPPPPPWKDRDIYPWLGIGLLLMAIVGNESYLRVQTKKNEWQLDRLDIEYSRRMQVKNESQKTGGEVQRLQQELNAKLEELKEQERLKNILDNVIRYRQELVPGLLQALGRSVNDEVVLDKVEERKDGKGFYLEAWALKDSAGQLFVSRLNENLARWQYKVEEMQLARGVGRLKIDGFMLKIWLVNTAPVTAVPQAAQPSGTPAARPLVQPAGKPLVQPAGKPALKAAEQKGGRG